MNVDKAIDIYFGIMFAAFTLLLAFLSAIPLYFFFAYGWDLLPGLLIGMFLLMLAGASAIMSWTIFQSAGR